ncbi:radical SAM/SPASM domain-containing protein [Paenibacillus faecis]|uniref:radical SAM/SPASM domain-containing protein n=1 Tax=Paenibacillus faecis TaxID=862114 RepID=UPI001B869B6D|nr:radical SAM protein [Paenibacillus faecis]
MLETIRVKDKSYLFFRHSLMMFACGPEVEDAVERLKRGAAEEDGNAALLRGYAQRDAEAKRRIEAAQADYMDRDLNIAGCDINVFYGCNLNCKYCFAEGGSHGKRGAMTRERAREVVDYVLDHAGDNDQLKVTIIGGEPLMNLKVFEEVASYGTREAGKRNKTVRFATTTNGTLLTERALELLHQYDVAYIISLDSHDRATNDFLRGDRSGGSAYDAIMKRWDALDEREIIRINVTVTPYNMNLSEIARHLFARGVNYIHFTEVKSDRKDMCFTPEQIEELKREYDQLADLLLDKLISGERVGCYPLLKDLNKLHTRRPVLQVCSTLNRRVAFSPDGKIYPCDMLMWDDYCLGDTEQGADPASINGLKQRLADEGECDGCWARYLCGGECLADKLWDNREQRALRCELKRHIFSLKLYIYDALVHQAEGFEFSKY